MTTKTKGRPLPPLLPLEYCPIGRAAKMLECETEDIFHWAEIGAVTLSVNASFDSLKLIVNNDTRNELTELAKANNNDDFDYLTLVINRCVINIKHSELTLTENDRQPVAFSSHGIWRIPLFDSLIFAKQEGRNEGMLLYVSTGKGIADKISLRGYPDADGLPIKINISDLVITSDQIQLLHDSITTGKPLANRYNNSEIAAEMTANERPPENNTPTKAMALHSLCEYLIKTAKLDPKLINRPDALQTAVNKELLKLGISEIGGIKTLYNAWKLAIPELRKM